MLQNAYLLKDKGLKPMRKVNNFTFSLHFISRFQLHPYRAKQYSPLIIRYLSNRKGLLR